MTELKTLKDIGFEPHFSSFDTVVFRSMMREQYDKIRQEAIKWYKEIDACSKDFKKTIVLNDNLICLADIPVPEFTEKRDPTWLLKQWIKHFFNLKDSELK